MEKIKKLLENSTAVVLVGGESSRMNYKDKYKLKIEEKSFLECILNELENFNNILISCNKNQNTEDFKNDYVIDKFDKIGPIGGIYTAMEKVNTDLLFICSCDMPYIKQNIIDKLYMNYNENYDCIIPCIDDKIYPLFGIYNKRIINIVGNNIKTHNYKIRKIFEQVNTKYVNFEKIYIKNFANINTIDEYSKYCNLK